eukprot:tig00001374_g8512.t1
MQDVPSTASSSEPHAQVNVNTGLEPAPVLEPAPTVVQELVISLTPPMNAERQAAPAPDREDRRRRPGSMRVQDVGPEDDGDGEREAKRIKNEIEYIKGFEEAGRFPPARPGSEEERMDRAREQSLRDLQLQAASSSSRAA